MLKTWLGIALLSGILGCGAVDQDLGDNGTEGELRRHPAANPGGSTTPPSPPGTQADGGADASTNADAGPGISDPYVLDTTRPVLSHQELFDYLKPKNASDGTLLGTFQWFSRERFCPGQCEIWKASNPGMLDSAFPDYSPVALPSSGSIYVVPTQTPALGFAFNLFLTAPVPGSPNGYVFVSLSDAGVDDSGASVGAPPQYRLIGTNAFTAKTLLTIPSAVKGLGFPEGTPELNLGFNGARAIQFRGRIFKDGTLHIVSVVGQGGTGAGTHQLAIIGKLQGL